MGVYGDWLAFGASLKWPLKKLQFSGTSALASFFSVGGRCMRWTSKRITVCAAHRSDHLTDEYGRGPPVARGAGDQPLTVELQEKLGTWMDVHTCAVLPESTQTAVSKPLCWTNMWVHTSYYLTDLELMGDTGGEVGAGVSASSSSSSPHSSSLSGVMLLPSHTEWMETYRERKRRKE